MVQENEWRKKRLITGMSALKYAKVLGVSICTVYNWELGKTSPRKGIVRQRMDALESLFNNLLTDKDFLLKK